MFKALDISFLKYDISVQNMLKYFFVNRVKKCWFPYVLPSLKDDYPAYWLIFENDNHKILKFQK